MQRYVLIRLVQGAITLFGISIISFMLLRVTGDPLMLYMPINAPEEQWDIVRHNLGLDRPLVVQYGIFIGNAVRGDFGTSINWGRPNLELVLERLPATLQLAGIAFAMSLSVGLPVGILSALRPGGLMDRFGKLFAVMGQSIPVFWLGIMLMLAFAVYLGLLPAGGRGGPQSLVLPAITLGWFTTAAITRLTRSAMLDVLDSEFIKMARIKGLPERTVILKHAVKNASISVLTFTSLQLVAMLNGAVITETIFSWPGIGRLIVDAVFRRDFPLVQTVVFLTASLYIVVNLVVDVLYSYLDPRIRLT